jgi:hypothetical protein
MPQQHDLQLFRPRHHRQQQRILALERISLSIYHVNNQNRQTRCIAPVKHPSQSSLTWITMEYVVMPCNISENEFGPVAECQGTTGSESVTVFDFTLLFQQSILSILPSAIFLLVSFIQILRLRGEATKGKQETLQYAKQVSTVVSPKCDADTYKDAVPLSALRSDNRTFLLGLS